MKFSQLVASVSMCGLAMLATASAAEFANMSSLLSRGSDYDKKDVIVSGYVCDNKDSANGLFLTLEDCEFANYGNAIRISVAGKTGVRKRGLIHLRGVFSRQADIVKTDDPYRWGELSVLIVY